MSKEDSKKKTAEFEKTKQFTICDEKSAEIKKALTEVYQSLETKGYNPVNQIVGYILSEEPTYITNYNNARAKMSKIDRYELMRALVQHFLEM